jgi:hypothetical protein
MNISAEGGTSIGKKYPGSRKISPKGYFTGDLPPKNLTSARRSKGHEYIRNIFLNKESGLKRPLGLWRLCVWERIVISVSVSCFRPVCRFFFSSVLQ